MKISRLAVGDRTLISSSTTYLAPPALAQNRHIEGLPLGTRGGMRVTHTFPLDGEYEFAVTANGIAGPGGRGNGVLIGGGGDGFGDAVEADGIGVEAMDEKCGDGGQADQPPGAALAGYDQCDESDAKENGEDNERPLVLAGEENEGQAVGELAEGGVGAVGDDGGGESGDGEEEKGQKHEVKRTLMS